MSKLVGLITAWCAEPFIEPAIKQALEYCDEVVVSVGVHQPNFRRFEDGTMDIVQKYKNDIKIVDTVPPQQNLIGSRGGTIAKMLTDTGNNKAGNWICILDCDEFYFPEDIDVAKQIIKEDKHLRIETPEKVFVVDTKHYATHQRNRFKKLIKDNTSFRNNEIGYEKANKPFRINDAKGMHHYTFLINPWFQREKWRSEYGNPNHGNQPKKWGWLDNVYMDLDLNDQQKSIDKCKQLGYGNSVLGLFFQGGCRPDGTLYDFDGVHPPFIEESGLTEIEDFRKIYTTR